MQLRLQTIGERKVDGFPTWSSFLARRTAANFVKLPEWYNSQRRADELSSILTSVVYVKSRITCSSAPIAE